jgi:hypothetical protein
MKSFIQIGSCQINRQNLVAIKPIAIQLKLGSLTALGMHSDAKMEFTSWCQRIKLRLIATILTVDRMFAHRLQERAAIRSIALRSVEAPE